MNNLIRKLSDQARFVSEPEYPDQDIIFEKFAKLIVRECVDRIKRVGILEDIEIESDMIADAIKETFGVELMSGGFFDYKEWHIDQIADDVKSYIGKCERKEERDFGYEDENGKYIPYFYDESEEVLNEFRKGLKILRQAFVYAKRIDYLLSGDDGDESFLKNLKKDLEELNARQAD